MTSTRDDIECIKNLPKDWWRSQNTVLIVASILEQYGYFNDRRAVIRFFEKPFNYQRELDEFVRDFKD